jgi:hypothetical protein
MRKTADGKEHWQELPMFFRPAVAAAVHVMTMIEMAANPDLSSLCLSPAEWMAREIEPEPTS